VTEPDGVMPDADPVGETTATGPIEAAAPSDGDPTAPPQSREQTDDAIEGPRRRARRETRRAPRGPGRARGWRSRKSPPRGRNALRVGDLRLRPKPGWRAERSGALKLFLLSLLLTLATTGVGLILYFTPVMVGAQHHCHRYRCGHPPTRCSDVAQVRLGTPLLQINTGRRRRPGGRRSAGWPAARVQRDYPSALADHHRRANSVGGQRLS